MGSLACVNAETMRGAAPTTTLLGRACGGGRAATPSSSFFLADDQKDHVLRQTLPECLLVCRPATPAHRPATVSVAPTRCRDARPRGP